MLKYPLIILLLITNVAIAQKSTEFKPDLISGVVQYSVNITLYKTKTYTDTLKFNRKKSVFQWHLQNTVGKNSQDRNYANPKKKDSKIIKAAHKDSIGRVNLYDVTKDSLYSRKFLVDRVYLLKEKNPNIQWKIQDTTKKIASYTCTKATAYFRGRNYTAWFTPDIPVPYGPWKLTGLPGLILQAYDVNKEIIFNAQKIVFTTNLSLGQLPLNGKEQVVTLEEYKDIINHLRKRLARRGHKAAREYMSENKNITIEVKVPEIKLMETFQDSTAQ